jgi:MmyB-like transcription regulator ligand binding domain
VIRNAGLGEFLRSRRARLDPAQAGLTSAAGRRVPGLRREELARLAGVSRITTPGWNRAARRAAVPAGEAGRGVQAVRPATYRLMELLAEAPAILLGRRTDILAVNDAARAVFTNFTALPARERNDRAAASRAADRRYFLAEMRIAREPLPVPADRQRP